MSGSFSQPTQYAQLYSLHFFEQQNRFHQRPDNRLMEMVQVNNSQKNSQNKECRAMCNEKVKNLRVELIAFCRPVFAKHARHMQ